MAVFSDAESNDSGGVNVSMADGSVRFIKHSVSQLTWMSLGTIDWRRSHYLRLLLTAGALSDYCSRNGPGPAEDSCRALSLVSNSRDDAT